MDKLNSTRRNMRQKTPGLNIIGMEGTKINGAPDRQIVIKQVAESSRTAGCFSDDLQFRNVILSVVSYIRKREEKPERRRVFVKPVIFQKAGRHRRVE